MTRMEKLIKKLSTKHDYLIVKLIGINETMVIDGDLSIAIVKNDTDMFAVSEFKTGGYIGYIDDATVSRRSRLCSATVKSNLWLVSSFDKVIGLVLKSTKSTMNEVEIKRYEVQEITRYTVRKLFGIFETDEYKVVKRDILLDSEPKGLKLALDEI